MKQSDSEVQTTTAAESFPTLLGSSSRRKAGVSPGQSPRKESEPRRTGRDQTVQEMFKDFCPSGSASGMNRRVSLPRQRFKVVLSKQRIPFLIDLSSQMAYEALMSFGDVSDPQAVTELLLSKQTSTNIAQKNHVLKLKDKSVIVAPLTGPAADVAQFSASTSAHGSTHAANSLGYQKKSSRDILGLFSLTERIIGTVTTGSLVSTTSFERVMDSPRFIHAIQAAWEASLFKGSNNNCVNSMSLSSVFTSSTSGFAEVLNAQGMGLVDLHGDQKDLRSLWRKFGIPPFLRALMWAKAVGNDIRVTADLFAIFSRRAVELMKQIADRRLLMNHGFANILSDKVASKKFFRSPTHRRLMFEQGLSLVKDQGLVEEDDHSPLFPEDELLEDGGREASLEVIWVDLPRTFGSTGLFCPGGALYTPAVGVLGSWVYFRPDVGYVQGMNYIAAVLLLHLEPFRAFQVFANLLTSPSLLGLFQLNREAVQIRYTLFNSLLEIVVPEVARAFKVHQIPPDMFLLEWFLSLFAKAIPFRAALVVWDLVLVDGEEMLFLTAVALVRCLRKKILRPEMDFASIAGVLTNPYDAMGGGLTTDKLLKTIRLVKKKAPLAFFKSLKGLSSEYS
eukprot:GDKK01059051.1.p1 GENE.GDKK01059051.1~~GDKK01059051.1.p1  ORF type:complete len:619 (-),score=123.00 GDKK01059051.1:72-1928(-)